MKKHIHIPAQSSALFLRGCVASFNVVTVTATITATAITSTPWWG
ncbi:MAG: hypothetical protein WCX31_15365 [Salinivirgaceae bacterium]